MNCSPSFKSFFTQNFPYYAKYLTDAQLQKIEAYAQKLTKQSTGQEVVDALSKSNDLMNTFVRYLKDHIHISKKQSTEKKSGVSRTDMMVGFAVLGLFGCLFAVLFLRKSLTGEAANTLTDILFTIVGVLISCVKDGYGTHRHSSSQLFKHLNPNTVKASKDEE